MVPFTFLVSPLRVYLSPYRFIYPQLTMFPSYELIIYSFRPGEIGRLRLRLDRYLREGRRVSVTFYLADGNVMSFCSCCGGQFTPEVMRFVRMNLNRLVEIRLWIKPSPPEEL